MTMEHPSYAEVSEEDLAQVELEREAMRIELEWLLASQVPILVERLRLVLKDCLTKFDPKTAHSEQFHILEHPQQQPVQPRPNLLSRLNRLNHDPKPAFTPSPFRALSTYDPAGVHFSQGQAQSSPLGSSPSGPSPVGTTAENLLSPLTAPAPGLASGNSSGTLASARNSVHSAASPLQVSFPSTPTIPGWTFPLTSPTDSLRGFVTLSGNSVVKADMTIKFARWNNGRPFQTSLAPSGPWILTQIQNSRNFVHMAVSELEDFVENFGTDFTKEDVLHLLTNVSTCLKRAMDTMTYTNANQKISETMYVSRSLFFPALPSDISIGFSVNFDKLLVSVHALHEVSLAPLPTHRRERSATITPTSVFGKSITVEGRQYEIVDHAELDFQVPSLTDALAVMGASYEKTYRMMNKLGVFS